MWRIFLPLARRLGAVPFVREYFIKKYAKHTIVMFAKSEVKIFAVTLATVLTQQMVQKMLPKIYDSSFFKKLQKGKIYA